MPLRKHNMTPHNGRTILTLFNIKKNISLVENYGSLFISRNLLMTVLYTYKKKGFIFDDMGIRRWKRII